MQIRVLSNINSGQYVAGDVVDMSDTEAKSLVEAGVATTEIEQPEAPEAQADQGTPVETTPPADPEAPAAPAPLAEGSDSGSENQPASVESPETPAPAEPVTTQPQPTPEQIQQDMQKLEDGSAASKIDVQQIS